MSARWLVLAATVSGTLAFGPLAPAAADTIYLVGGRVIHSESVRVEDGRLYFTQFGGTVSIPLAEVVRIVADDEIERATAPAVTVATEQAEGPGTNLVDTSPPADESLQPAYWVERILEVDEQIARVQAELDRLPRYDDVDRRLLRFSGQALYFIAERDKWEALMGDLQLDRKRLLRGARKAGIAPGALRKGLRR